MMAMTRTQRKFRDAFTLVEILIVVIILGVLAAIVLPLLGDALGSTQQASFISDIRIFYNSAQRYMLDTDQYLEDSASGQLPAGWDPYLRSSAWTRPTPIGGVWDFELDSFGIKSAFGVHFDGTAETRDDAYMQRIDLILDDGNLATGAFRKIANDRYYFILEDV